MDTFFSHVLGQDCFQSQEDRIFVFRHLNFSAGPKLQNSYPFFRLTKFIYVFKKKMTVLRKIQICFKRNNKKKKLKSPLLNDQFQI